MAKKSSKPSSRPGSTKSPEAERFYQGAADERLRLFFALLPPPPLAAALAGRAAELAGEYGGRALPAANLHLTLLFLGDVGAARLPALNLAASSAAAAWRPFTLQLDRLGYWPRQQLLWAGLQQAAPELSDFSAYLRSTVEKAGFSIGDAGRAFFPHLTLLRKPGRTPPDGLSLTLPAWPVSGFALLASTRTAAGASYRPLTVWPVP